MTQINLQSSYAFILCLELLLCNHNVTNLLSVNSETIVNSLWSHSFDFFTMLDVPVPVVSL